MLKYDMQYRGSIYIYRYVYYEIDIIIYLFSYKVQTTLHCRGI